MQDFRMNTFLTVCNLLNYTKAAELLHITQPAVSQHIRYLEEHYDVKLFCYEGKKLHLSEAGTILRNAATTMRHDELILSEQLKAGNRLRFVFGTTLTIGDFLLPTKLIRFLGNNPDAGVSVLVDNTQTLLRKIDTGELDFAIVEGYFHKAEYDYKIYSRERYIAICSPSFVFKHRPDTVSDLFAEPLILREKGSGTREIFERYLHERNHSPSDFQHIIEIGSISAIKQLVASDCGISFLYEAAVKQELDRGTLCQIPLLDFDVYNDFTFVWRKNSIYHKRYLEIFHELL